MKSKEEILLNYYKKAADGQPEISSADLLKAMEEYRQTAEEAAFNAARQSNSNLSDIWEPTFPTFELYQASLVQPAPPEPPAPSEAANIQLIADSIFELFIPSDAQSKEVSFDIKTNGTEYSVTYTKTGEGYWQFTAYTQIGS